MIGYGISRQQLISRIETHTPGWMNRAHARTSGFQAKRKFSEDSSIWSEIKPVYMELQGDSKCAFCERKLESIPLGKGEQAVEHFRPKGKVSRWKIPTDLAKLGIRATEPPKGEGGYYMLAYDVFNYSAACNPCNSALKRDYFPIAGIHQLPGTTPENLMNERPFLIYPIGDFDSNPEDLIRFHGMSPYATSVSQWGRERGLTTIKFFRLDDPERTNLLLERAKIIVALYLALETIDDANCASTRKLRARSIVTAATSDKAAHANCARSFCDLYRRDPEDAERISNNAAAFVASKS